MTISRLSARIADSSMLKTVEGAFCTMKSCFAGTLARLTCECDDSVQEASVPAISASAFFPSHESSRPAGGAGVSGSGHLFFRCFVKTDSTVSDGCCTGSVMYFAYVFLLTNV